MNTLPSPDEDPLEMLLRKNSAPLADDGFSARVLAALPPPPAKPRARPNRRAIACSVGTLTGLIWAIIRSGPPRLGDLAVLGSELQSSTTTIVKALGDPNILMLGTLILASLAFAFSREIIAKLD